jgi:hypothetical protein
VTLMRSTGSLQMEEFTVKMRGLTSHILPQMSDRLYRPQPASVSSETEDQEESALQRTEEDDVVSGWFNDVVAGAEQERQELIRARGLKLV